AISAGVFQPTDGDKFSGTLEISLVPKSSRGSDTILSFDGDGRSVMPFSLQQHGSALSVRRHNIDDLGKDRIAVFEVENALRAGQPVFVSVVLSKHETAVYLDGKPAKTEEILGVSADNFIGRLVVGDSSRTSDGWSGEIRELAIYREQLTTPQINQHFLSWT